jgi:hypothetical protein
MKNNILSLLVLVLTVFCSCSDAALQQQVIGKWKSEVKTEDGKEITYYHIIKGGRLEEKTFFRNTASNDVKGIEKFESSVKGKWHVIFGDIHFDYDISSLEVQYTGMEFPHLSQSENKVAIALVKRMYPNLIEEDEEEMYNNLYDYYNTQTVFQNVKINDNEMTVSIGEEIIKLIKIKFNQ